MWKAHRVWGPLFVTLGLLLAFALSKSPRAAAPAAPAVPSAVAADEASTTLLAAGTYHLRQRTPRFFARANG
jgi:hypothetical protein